MQAAYEFSLKGHDVVNMPVSSTPGKGVRLEKNQGCKFLVPSNRASKLGGLSLLLKPRVDCALAFEIIRPANQTRGPKTVAVPNWISFTPRFSARDGFVSMLDVIRLVVLLPSHQASRMMLARSPLVFKAKASLVHVPHATH